MVVKSGTASYTVKYIKRWGKSTLKMADLKGEKYYIFYK